MSANIGDTDQLQRSAASDLGLHCLYMSHKRMLGLNGLKALDGLGYRGLSLS